MANGWSKGGFDTWADGFGRWYAAIPDWASAEVARSLILIELQQRGHVDPERVVVEYVNTDAWGRLVFRERWDEDEEARHDG